MKKLLLKSMLLLCALIVGSSSVWADPTTIASLVNNTTTGWTISGATSSGSGTGLYWKLINSSHYIESPEITWGNYTNIKIKIKGRTFGGVEAAKNKISVSQGSTELTSYTPSSATLTYSSELSISPTTGAIKIACLGADGSKGAGISEIIITGELATSTPSSGASFANPSPSLDLKDAATFSQTASTVAGYPSTDGALVTYSIGSKNTALATINSSTGVVTPTQAGEVIVQASAAAIDGKYLASNATYTLTVTDTREWDITCHIGNNTSVETRTSGATLSLDDPSAICGMSFVGWSSTNNAANPTWVANTTKVTGDMVLFAMYQAVAGRYSYHLVETNQADWRGKYLVAYDNETFANGKTNGTSGIGSASTVKDPGDNLSGKIVAAAWGDEYYVTIEAVDDEDLTKGYLLKTQDDYYNYHTGNTNNGISGTSTNKSTASGHAITVNFVSSNEINLAVSDGPIFRYNTSSNYFRFYRTASYASQGKVYLYKRSEDVAPVYSLGTTVAITPGYAKITYVTPEIMDFSNVLGLKAYVATDAAAAGVTMTRVEAAVPEGTPLLLIGTAGTTYNVPIIASATVPATNKLVAGDGATDMSGVSGYNYILYSDGLFYQVTSGTIATTKAYLHLTSDPTAGGARSLDIVFDDETTGIDATLVNSEKVNSDVYDLQGRKVAQPTKGLYIVNGKKVIIK